jgi:hypothetical protein
MRPLAAISLLVAACLHAQPGSVVGVVLDRTGRPLAGVHIRLTGGDLDSNAGPERAYGAISDQAGKFSMEAVIPGAYSMTAERKGFVQQTSRLAVLVVKPGQNVTDYRIEMAARAVIMGRVVDEYGDPVQGMSVQLQPVAAGQSQDFNLMGSFAQTDYRGEFRLTTGSGKYYLKASEMQRFREAPEIRTDGTPGAPFAPTYYPSAAGAGSASVIEVAAGQDIGGLEIRLLRAGIGGAARTFTISGVVNGIVENANAMVSLQSGETPGQYRTGRTIWVSQDGKFSFSQMEPGYYGIGASSTSGKTTLRSHTVEFHLESADETGLQLTLAPPEELEGKLEWVGEASTGETARQTIRLEAASREIFGQANPSTAEIRADGSFHITGIPPAKFKVVVEPMPENGYLKEVALDGKALPDRVLDFSQGVGGARLKVTVSRNGGAVSGRVLDKDGEPALGRIFVLFGVDAKHMDGGTTPLDNGKFSFKGVRPGKYRILAIDIGAMASMYSGAEDRDDVMQRIFDAGAEVEVNEGNRISKDIPLWTKLPAKKEAP